MSKLTAIQKSQRLKKRLEQKLDKLTLARLLAQNRWEKGFQRFMKSATDLASLKITQSKRADRLRQIIHDWPNDHQRLMKVRESLEQQINGVVQQLRRCDDQLFQLENAVAQLQQQNDAIVDQVFVLNNEVVAAAHARDAYLMSQVFTYLRKPDGSLRRQVTFISSDQLRKVVAMVNSISYLDASLAERAEEEINDFFARYQVPLVADPLMAKVTELLRNVLTSKRNFQVGPALYEFLTMKVDEKLFPELVRAQQYLKASFRSEKTNSYVRIFSRPTVTDKWQPVPQS
ncbi:MAG TPA: hypothetical protein PL066_02905 [bacterium]|nr:hypothetical protein [bacterium]